MPFLSRHPVHPRFRADDHFQTEVGQAFFSRHPVRRHFKGDDHMQTEVGGPAMYTPQQLAVMRARAYSHQVRAAHNARVAAAHLAGTISMTEGDLEMTPRWHPTPSYATPAQLAMAAVPHRLVRIGHWPHLVQMGAGPHKQPQVWAGP
jgi:hypothetical protein